jgi:redox-sensitive bicupin YhaK (pirin superfamily)
MITLRRNKERHHVRRRLRDVWHTFYPQKRGLPLAGGFGAIEGFDEDRLLAGGGIRYAAPDDLETVIYVREGALAQEDSRGGSGVIRAGEFQRTTGRGVRRGETNASRTDSAQVFRISLHPSQVGLAPSEEVKRFSAGQRRGEPCAVASPDGRQGSLSVHEDVVIYSSIIDAGQHVVHELSPGRSAWFHLIRGEVVLGDVVLTAGDGAGVSGDRAVSLTAREESEFLLLDLGAKPPRYGTVPSRPR